MPSTPAADLPLDEAALRRPGFRGDTEVVLSDGRPWWLPRPHFVFALRFDGEGPPRFESDGSDLGEDYGRLYDTFVAAEGGLPMINALAALAVDLLRRNYDLDGPALRRLLRYAPGDPANVAMWQRIADVAMGRRDPNEEDPDDNG